MTWVTKPCPKPRKKVAPTGRPRTRLKRVNRKRGGSAFPKMRDPEFCTWVVTTQRCVGLGLMLPRRVSLNDVPDLMSGLYRHVCWGDFTPAHVGKHRAQGVRDRGHVVCMCQALHDYYDHHRPEFSENGIAATTLEYIAAGLGLRWVDRGGQPNA